MGSNFHFVIYPINQNNEFNFISILKRKLNKEELSDNDYFKNNKFLKSLSDQIYEKSSLDLKGKLENIKSFPIFVSKSFEILKHKNIKSPKKVIFGSGKIIVDLLSDDGIKNIDSGTEIVSLEQLYPFPIKEIKEILNGAELKEILWVQEEPRNRGAWKYFNENIIEIHENKLKVNYVGRKPSATTATGSSSVHKIQQKRIIDSILK